MPYSIEMPGAIGKSNNKEYADMKIRRAAVVTATCINVTVALAASSADAPNQKLPPESIRRLIDRDAAMLAYKSVPAGDGRETAVLILRSPKAPDLDDWKSWEDRPTYKCEMIMIEARGDGAKITGRTTTTVDCEVNDFNRRSRAFDLNEGLELSTTSVSFRNDNPRGGSYTYSFRFSDGAWHLSDVTVFYKDYQPDISEVVIAKEQASYPKDFGFISMDDFDPKGIEDAVVKNKTFVP